MPKFSKSKAKNKKYAVRTPGGKLINFGAIKPDGTPYPQFKDSTGLGLYSKYDHNDKARRERYRARHKKILTKEGKPAYLDPEKGAYYAWRYLW